ncbi:MAG TPA: hypothetical protein VF313_13240 [Anaerolineaceae bacterium]|jgi:hypothetical protein
MGNHLEVTPSRRPRRSFELWVLVCLLLASGLAGFLRLQAALYSWDVLIQIGLKPGPLYPTLSGAAWGLLSFVAAVGLIFRQRWAPNFTRIGAAGMALAYWIDRLVLTRSSDAQINTPFAAGATALLVFFAFGVLALERQKQYFNR